MPRVRIAGTGDVAPGSGKTVEVQGRSIALFNVDGTFHAIDNTCTHVGGPLGDGMLDGEIVSCPWHGAQFNVKTGEVLSPPAATPVACYPVLVEGDDVLVELD
ncbi:MAG: Rieske (2Fe-2S) protein [Planctomycetota bacterium]